MGLFAFNRAREQGKAIPTAPQREAQVAQQKSEEDRQKVNALIRNLNGINADEVQFVAEFLNIEYTTKAETVSAIKTKLGK